jgi:hypothetical protein
LTVPVRAGVVAVAGLCLVFAWRSWTSSEERAIRGRLDALTTDVNRTVGEGLGSVVRAADIGSFFTDDVVVDLGEGAAPIVGRTTLVGMAARLQRRTAAFRLRLDDVGVRVAPGGTAADVSLTASFALREETAEGESMDAREFALSMTKASGVWKISRVAAVDTLR